MGEGVELEALLMEEVEEEGVEHLFQSDQQKGEVGGVEEGVHLPMNEKVEGVEVVQEVHLLTLKIGKVVEVGEGEGVGVHSLTSKIQQLEGEGESSQTMVLMLRWHAQIEEVEGVEYCREVRLSLLHLVLKPHFVMVRLLIREGEGVGVGV